MKEHGTQDGARTREVEATHASPPAAGPTFGMDRDISRRDFLNGIAIGVGGLMAGAVTGETHGAHDVLDLELERQRATHASALGGRSDVLDYPPTRTGMRGSHPGSFEAAHALRDRESWVSAAAVDTGEQYDLVVVGAGISGLSAAYFFRARHPEARVLLLDNHDDFGGHAKRNEFRIGDRLLLLNGGTLGIDSPTPYSRVADGLLKELGIDPPSLAAAADDPKLYASLGLQRAVFFDHQTFGADRLVVGVPGRRSANRKGEGSWSEFLSRTPLSQAAQRDIARIEEGTTDYLPGLSSTEKKDKLSRISYADYLLTVVGAHPDVVPFYQTRTHGEWGVGIDAEPALDCWALGLPGFQGLRLEPGPAPRMSYTAAGYAAGGSYRFHFPDGNASIARALVRRLVPGVLPGHTAQDIVTARADYTQLDQPRSAVRIRLSSTVIRARHAGDPATATDVQVLYAASDGRTPKIWSVRAKSVVLAGWNMMIPGLCPELPDPQKEALRYLVKVPLVYASVAIQNWNAFSRLLVRQIESPGSYWSSVALNWAVNVGAYRTPRRPEDPTLLHLVRTPCKPGLPVRQQQIAGRTELLTTSFETFEHTVRDQLGRMLGVGGFDAASDIVAITVNRWPHGYGYEYNPLFDPPWPPGEAPHEIGRRRFGRIAIANSDSGATAYTDVAIDQAWRAVQELES